MKTHQITRRRILKGTLAAAVLPSGVVLGQTTPVTRMEWTDFKASAQYPIFYQAVRVMRNNRNFSDPKSWGYWVNAHLNYCPHGTSYFLLWHRGLVYQFEQQLRAISGNSSLAVPYWDYFKYATMPPEYTTTGTPFYIAGRVNTNVYSALGLNPFSPSLTVFPRGATDSFERQMEGRPHNAVHNLIGGEMARRTSPNDAIFWMHHGNVDRLWAAWVAADNGRQMPPPDDPYWSGTLRYSPDLTMPASAVMTTEGLGYRYDNETLPTSLPPSASAARLVQVQLQLGKQPPELNGLSAIAPKAVGNGRRALGGIANVPLDERGASFLITIPAAERAALDAVLNNVQSAPFVGGGSATQFRSAQIVLGNIKINDEGREGGYFYNVYLRLPGSGNPRDAGEDSFLGTLGPFEIDASLHHSPTPMLSYSVTRMLAGMPSRGLSGVKVVLERINGKNYPRGKIITVGEARLELSTTPDE